jgi:hypothetical protein
MQIDLQQPHVLIYLSHIREQIDGHILPIYNTRAAACLTSNSQQRASTTSHQQQRAFIRSSRALRLRLN